MIHYASPGFWDGYHALPVAVRELADRKYALLKRNPSHPSLHLKRLNQYWSVRVGLHYRALGLPLDEGILCFWIGTHAEYDAMVT